MPLRNRNRNTIPAYRVGGGGQEPFSFGNALEFDGVNDYVSLTSEITLQTNTNFTISTWVKTTDTTADSINRVANPVLGDNTGGQIICFGVDDGKAVFQLFTGTWTKVFGTSNVADGNWHNIVWVNNSNETIDIYVDGVSEVSSANSASIYSKDINSLGASLLRTFDGVIDETGYLQGTAATAQNISNLYNSGNGNDFAEIMGSSTLHYKLNEVSGDSNAIDSSGNGNTGTLNNFNTSTCWVAH